jgi:hypothetical protein
MSQKYFSSAAFSNRLPRLITNDLYLAAFLLCQGCEWCGLVRNERRRLSFVFSGERVHELRSEYESGTVRLNVRSFKDHLLAVRRRMDEEQRSAAYGPDPAGGVRAAQA